MTSSVSAKTRQGPDSDGEALAASFEVRKVQRCCVKPRTVTRPATQKYTCFYDYSFCTSSFY